MTTAASSTTMRPNSTISNGCNRTLSSNISETELATMMEKPHLDIVVWLKTLQLHEQYGRLFEKFSGVEEIIDYSGRELLDLGVKNAAHRSQLQSGLVVLREKYKKAVVKKNVTKLVSFYEKGQADTVEEMDGNMNRIETTTSSSSSVSTRQNNTSTNMVVVSSDEENYINHRLQYSTSISPRKISNLNVVNNNEAFDADDLRGHLWYHGTIGRSQAEALVESGRDDEGSGRFLVRDCISRAGNYVLTCRWNGNPLHFMINRTVLNSSPTSLYERAVYNFEDESYQSVPDLIRAYVGQKKLVTEESRCTISKPVNRSVDGSPNRSKSESGNSNSPTKIVPDKFLFSDEKINSRILDDDREQGNYVRMRENRNGCQSQQSISDSSSNRGSISSNGIANLKIPQVPESIRNRPLPPVPRLETGGGSSMGHRALTLRNRVMLKEARRHQLNKWRSESALEDRSNQDEQTSEAEIDSGNANEIALHGSASLQSLNNSDPKSNNASSIEGRRVVDEETTTPTKAPAKPRRAPSLKNKEKPTLVIRDNRTGRFREISETELENETEYLDEDDDGDYHEYCDIDYDELPPANNSRPTPTPTKANVEKETRMENEKKFENPPPALPPRPKFGSAQFSIQDRDSACVPDMIVYDRPNDLCKPYSPRLKTTKIVQQNQSDHYDTLKGKTPSRRIESRLRLDIFESPLLPTDCKPLDNRVWIRVRDFLLRQDAADLASAATKADVTYMNLLEEEKLLDFVVDRSLPALILLPNGKPFRRDLVERTTCSRYFVASTLLQDESSATRVRLLAKWIDVAKSAKDKYGNDYAFGNIMGALLSFEISNLSACWLQLRMDFAEQADTFETFLKPRFYAMQRCQKSQDEICIPDLEPMATLLDAASIDEMRNADSDDGENSGDDLYGLDSFWQRLQEARQWPSRIHQWRLKYRSQLIDEVDCGEKAEDIFRTEFHLRYLFGIRGATVGARERYDTFQRILSVMALKIGGNH